MAGEPPFRTSLPYARHPAPTPAERLLYRMILDLGSCAIETRAALLSIAERTGDLDLRDDLGRVATNMAAAIEPFLERLDEFEKL